MDPTVLNAREVLHNISGHDYDSCGNYPLERREAEKIINILNKFISKNGEKVDTGELSDGYHTFNQLYHQRAVLFACIVNQNKNKAWKSFKHSDGKYCFDSDGEWFIVGVDTPQGSYTYHYSKEYWDMFDCQELECGKEWDGHTEEDVTRLLSLQQELRWIPISERLPEEHCLFYDIDGDIYYGHIYDNKWWAEGQNDKIKNVVAWMPLTGSIVVGEK